MNLAVFLVLSVKESYFEINNLGVLKAGQSYREKVVKA